MNIGCNFELAELCEKTLDLIEAIKAVPQWQRRAEARLARKLGNLSGSAVAAVIENLSRSGVPVSDVMGTQIILPWRDAEERMAMLIADAAEESAKHARNTAIDQLRKAGVSVTDPPDMTRTVIHRIRDRAFNSSLRTFERLRGDVMGTLAQSYADGLGIDEAAERLGELSKDMESYELRRVARTEIQSTQNQVAHESMREFGVVYEKWVAASDDRTRDTHADVNGEIIPIDGEFSNGLAYPGDTNGPLEEWINCRCRVVPYIMPPGKSPPAGQSYFRESDVE